MDFISIQYKVFNWFAKPDEFSPIECARHGWINFAKDTLKCVACSNIVYIYSKVIKPYDPELLSSKHNQNCPWRTIVISGVLR